MARDFEDIHNTDDLNDAEMRELVRTHLRAHSGVDPDDVNVTVRDGRVVLEGRVGTDGERRIAEHVITDVLGLVDVENNLVVDPIRRAESPAAIDDHLAEEARTEGLALGDQPVSHSPEAEHLEEDPKARLHGTTDVGKSIIDGTAWIPPESPTQEGLEGSSDGPKPGEDH